MGTPPRTAAWAFLLALAAVLPSLPWVDAPWVVDDRGNVRDNPSLDRVLPIGRFFRDPSTLAPHSNWTTYIYRPLMPLTLAIDRAWMGNRPRPHRLGNLLLHALASVLVFLVAGELLRLTEPGGDAAARTRLAAATGLLYAVHPVATWAARYISNRGLLIAVVGILGAVLAHLRARRSPRPATWVALALGAQVLAHLGKENAVVLPALLLAIEGTAGAGDTSPREAVVRVAPSAILAAGYLALREVAGVGVTGHPGGRDLGAWASEVWGQVEVIATQYLPNFLWPVPVRFHPAGPTGEALGFVRVASATLLVVLGATLVRRRREAPLALLGGLALALSLAPTSLTRQPMPSNHHRVLVGSPFVFLALVTLARPVIASPASVAPLLGVAGILAGVSAWHGSLGMEPRRLWAHSVRFGGSAYAVAEHVGGIQDPALRVAAIDAARARGVEDPRLWWLRGEAGLALGRDIDAAADLARALPEGSRPPPGDAGEDPRTTVLHAVQFAMDHGHPHQALSLARVAEPRFPDLWQLPYVRGVILHRSGEVDEAAAAYRRAFERGGRDLHLLRNWGMVLRQAGRCDHARQVLEQALRLAPDDPVARGNLELCGGG